VKLNRKYRLQALDAMVDQPIITPKKDGTVDEERETVLIILE